MAGFESIEVGKKGILAHQQGMSVIGHNLSNQATEGYSRQKVTMSTAYPLQSPGLNREERAGQVGQGVNATLIARVKDEILESRIDAMASQEEYYSVRENYLKMMGDIYNEPENASVRKAMDNYWSALNELSNNPGEISSRQNVVQSANTLAESINGRYYNLKGITDQAEIEIKENVGRINEFLGQIADLSKKIKASQNAGDNPNDLLDARDILTERLGKMINITVNKRDGNFAIHMDGENLLANEVVREIKMKENPNNEGYMDLQFKDTGREFIPKSGSLGALLSIRDGDARNEINSLDNMTVNMVSYINDIHRQGVNREGQSAGNFFTEYPFVNNKSGNYDANGDGTYDSTYLFSMKGKNSLDISEQVGLVGEITMQGPAGEVKVKYNPTDTIRDVLLKINHSGAEMVASLDKDGKLVLKGMASTNKDTPDFVIKNFSDSGDFLVGYSGILKPGEAYDYKKQDAANSLDSEYAVAPIVHPSAYIKVEKALMENASKVAAGLTTSPGDGEIAVAMAGIRSNDIMLGKTASFDEYFANSVADIGIKSREAMTMREEKELNIKDLRDYRDGISGVNVNEEMSEMMKFQHGYNASARFLVTIDKMLDTIIGLK